MNLATWTERNGVARVTAYRWFRSGRLPVPAQRVGRLILVNDAAAEAAQHPRTAAVGSAGSALNMSRLHSLPRAASWSWWTQPRLTMIWCAI